MVSQYFRNRITDTFVFSWMLPMVSKTPAGNEFGVTFLQMFYVV